MLKRCLLRPQATLCVPARWSVAGCIWWGPMSHDSTGDSADLSTRWIRGPALGAAEPYSILTWCAHAEHPSVAEGAPFLAGQSHPTKNGGLTPHNVTTGSARQVCDAADHLDHPWTSPVQTALLQQSTWSSSLCWDPHMGTVPASSRSAPRAWQMQSAHHAAQPDAGPLSPSSVAQVWWLCREAACGHTHEWQTDVAHRALKASGCPACAGQQPCVCNSLQAVHPQTVQAQWDWERNAPLTPDQLLPQSNQSVHWRCGLHTPPYLWQANPNRRFSAHRTGCPGCANARRGRTLVSTPEEQLSLAAPAAVAG